MALPKTDAFTVASDQRISTYNANWVENWVSEFTILAASDDVYHSKGGSTGEGSCHWQGDAFNDNQYAQVVVNAITSDNWIGPACRVASGETATHYGFYGSSSSSYLFKVVAGTWVQLGSTGAAFVTTSTYRIEANSTTITPKKDGVTTGIGAQTNSDITSGYGGLCGYSTSASQRVDNFEGGNLGGTAYSLTAEAGSYAMTGNAATLKVGRKVSADAGAYTYTGNATALKYGYKLSAASGTYTYTGQDATAKLTRKLALDAGAYTCTGQDATPKAGRKLSLDAGSYAITGQDASAKYGHKLSADAGTYTYTGNAASLLAGRKTSLDAGAYTYAGATIIINKGVRLSLDTGTYTYTGIDATTKLTRKLLSDAGTYTYTGNALTINKGVMLSLDTGTYTYTGADAAFKLAYKIAGDLGQYVYTGNAATLTYTPTGATYDLEGFRWRNDDGDEDAATWKTTQDAMAYSQLTSPVRLRVLVNATGDTASAAYQLETRIAGSSDDWEVIA